MTMLIGGRGRFLAIHFLVSGTRLRDALMGALGEGPIWGCFRWRRWRPSSGWSSFNAANGGPDDRMLYNLGVGVKHLAIPVVALAFFIGVQGLLAPNPTSVGQQGSIAKEGTIHGVVRITRHPFLWGVAIWAAFHVAANGNLASVLFLGRF